MSTRTALDRTASPRVPRKRGVELRAEPLRMLRLQNLVDQREALRLQRLHLLQRQRRLRLLRRFLCDFTPTPLK